MIRFQAKYLPALLAFVAKDDLRFYLRGIHVTPHKDGGAVLVATDGHRMLCIRDTSAVVSEPVTVAVSRDAARYAKKEGAVVTVNQITGRLIVSDQDGEIFVQPKNCVLLEHDAWVKYPDYCRILPKNFADLKRGSVDGIQAKLLSECVMVHPMISSKMFHKRFAPIRLWQTSETGSVYVEYEGAPEYIGIIMPVRTSTPHDKVADAWEKTFAQAGVVP